MADVPNKPRDAPTDQELEDLMIRGIDEWWDLGPEKGLLPGQLNYYVYEKTGHFFHDNTVYKVLARLEKAGRVKGVDAIHRVLSYNLDTGEEAWRGARMRRYFPATEG